MAEIVDQLRLDIDQALRDVDRLGTALDRVAATPIEVEVDTREADQLAETLREVQRIADRAATETQSIALAAGEAEVNFEDMARALDISEDEARRLTTELLETQAASNRVEDAARDIARQLGLSDNEAERLTRSLRQADTAAEAIDVTAIRMAGRFDSLRTAAQSIAATFAVIGGAQIFGAIIRGANAAVQSFAQLEDSINAVNVVFKDGAGIALDFGETAAQAAGLSREAFNNAVAPIGALLTNFGFEAREAADNAVILIQRGADLASVYGGSVQEALLAINSALVGQVEPLRRFGAEISQARVEAFALSTGLLQAGQQMDTATAVQARLGLILKDTNVVAGDFVNTSEDLANAQRIAAAEAQNFGADVGEVLAPAMEVLVGLVPDLLEGLRQLVPGFANAADSAASFFDEIKQDSGGFRAPLQALGAGLALVGDVFGGIGDQASFLFDTFTLEFGRAGEQVEQFNARIARTSQRIIGQNLARALDDGADSATAFGNAIAAFGRGNENIDVFANSFRTFAIQANLSSEELQFVTAFLIENAAAAGFSADEVEFLRNQLALLNDTLNDTDVGAQRTANRIRGDLGEAFSTTTTTFTTFAGATETASERASNALEQLAIEAEAQAQRTANAFNLFEELPDKIKGSFTAAVDALREQVAAIADFDINIALLRAFNLDALADDFEDKGIAAADQLAQAVNNIPEAIEADQLLQGMGIIGEEAFDALVERFVESGITPADVAQLKQSLASPEVIAAAEEAARLIAVAQAESYHERLTTELDQLVPEQGRVIARNISEFWPQEDAAALAGERSQDSYISGVEQNLAAIMEQALAAVGIDIDLFDDGVEARNTFFDGLSTPQAGEASNLRGSITATIDEAIYRDSPPKLFLDIGKESGDAFWAGFNQADLTLKTAIPDVKGQIITGDTLGTGSGVNIQLITNNPIQMDEVSDTARMGQIASSIAASYRSVVPNGM